MSILPYLRFLEDTLRQPSPLYDQDFGLGLYGDDLLQPRLSIHAPHAFYIRPWRHTKGRDSGVSNVLSSDNQFKVNLDVQQFKPDEISVKVVDNSVIIEGKHEERQDDHGFISRQFQRRYLLPDNVDPKAVVSSLSSDGVLAISAPKKQKQQPGNELVIPIVQTNQPAVKESKAPKKEEAGDSMEQ